MADKLDWMNKHLILVRYVTVEDTVAQEKFKIRPDLEKFFAGVSSVEEMVNRLDENGKYKDACEFMSYITHRRAGIWWAYRCVLSLLEELRENPAVDRDIASIATDFTPTVPDFAKVELPKMSPETAATIDGAMAKAKSRAAEMRTLADPEMLKYVEDAVEVAFQEFKRVHGVHPIELLKQIGARINEPRIQFDPNSPIFTASADLKMKLGALQKETVDAIKSVLPPKVPEHEKMLRDNALAAVYRWVAAPDAENSQKCLDVGNECPDTPAGLLCLSAFWAFGDLLPMGQQVVATPPGLAANGLSQVLLMCALHKGGTRKPNERYEEYFRLGIEVLTGADNWDASLVEGKAPHEEIPSEASPQPAPPTPPAADQPRATPPVAENGAQSEPTVKNGASSAPSPGIAEMPSYKRWKPNGGTE
jgi:hypothetical protein